MRRDLYATIFRITLLLLLLLVVVVVVVVVVVWEPGWLRWCSH